MIEKEDFVKIVKLAEKHGYKEHMGWFPIFFEPITITQNKLDRLIKTILWQHRYEIIFSHAFAKAVFGEKDDWHTTECTCGGSIHPLMDMHTMDCAKISCKRDWKFHIQQMTLEEDPFEYIKNFIDKNDKI